MACFLLCCGDIEANPGPRTRSNSVDDSECLPDNPAEQTKLMFKLLKDVHERTLESTKFQTEVTADIKAIKEGQKSIENKMTAIQQRLDELEQKSEAFPLFEEQLSQTEQSLAGLTNHTDYLTSRVDELEDRSRRNNLIFHGIADAKETWEQTEARLTSVLSSVMDSFQSDAIERAHRLGSFSPNKARPVIAMFTNFKQKQKVLSLRSQLKLKDVAVNEDFSVTTRIARRKLIEFAKSQPGSPSFQLSYKRLFIDKKCYIYNASIDTVEQIETRDERPNRTNNAASPALS